MGFCCRTKSAVDDVSEQSFSLPSFLTSESSLGLPSFVTSDGGDWFCLINDKGGASTDFCEVSWSALFVSISLRTDTESARFLFTWTGGCDVLRQSSVPKKMQLRFRSSSQSFALSCYLTITALNIFQFPFWSSIGCFACISTNVAHLKRFLKSKWPVIIDQCWCIPDASRMLKKKKMIEKEPIKLHTVKHDNRPEGST